MDQLLAYEFDRAMERERVFKDPLDPLYISDTELLKYYRFPRHELQDIIVMLEPDLKRDTNRNHVIPVASQELVALRFYASGCFKMTRHS